MHPLTTAPPQPPTHSLPRADHNNFYAYVDGSCFGVGSFMPDHEDGFFNNTCLSGSYGRFDCTSSQLPEMHDNLWFSTSSPVAPPLTVCGKTLAEWQSEGHDLRTRALGTGAIPPAHDLITLAKSLLSK